MNGALSHLRVVELGSGLASAYTAKLLADLGADVVKIEPPSGDATRRLGDGASDLHAATGEVDVLDSERRRFTPPQPGVREKQHERP